MEPRPDLSPRPLLCEHRAARLSWWLVAIPCPRVTRRGLKKAASLRCSFHPPLVMVVTAVRWLGPRELGRSEGIELDQGEERLAHRFPSIQPLHP